MGLLEILQKLQASYRAQSNAELAASLRSWAERIDGVDVTPEGAGQAIVLLEAATRISVADALATGCRSRDEAETHRRTCPVDGCGARLVPGPNEDGLCLDCGWPDDHVGGPPRTASNGVSP